MGFFLPNISTLRKLNDKSCQQFQVAQPIVEILECHSFPIPKIEKTDMIRSMEGFSFASVSDLNMRYYNIKLDSGSDAQKLCTFVFPWERYQ
jgi:hypothetical protein